jgi:DNA-directed RNA polymerase subunit RPC12/RpoP
VDPTRNRCHHCGGRVFLSAEAPHTHPSDAWVYACVNCSRTRMETEAEVWVRCGMEPRSVERARVSAEIRAEQGEKRRRRRVRKVA